MSMDEETATIQRVQLDDERGLSVCVMVGASGWGQGFGNIVCASEQERREFVQSIATVFGVSPDALVGQACSVHRCFGMLDTIEGLTSVATGRTFTITAWRKRQGYPAPTPLEARMMSREREIQFLKRRLAEEEASFDRIVEQYRPITGEAP